VDAREEQWITGRELSERYAFPGPEDAKSLVVSDVRHGEPVARHDSVGRREVLVGADRHAGVRIGRDERQAASHQAPQYQCRPPPADHGGGSIRIVDAMSSRTPVGLDSRRTRPATVEVRTTNERRRHV
jgi:hypothetical protein